MIEEKVEFVFEVNSSERVSVPVTFYTYRTSDELSLEVSREYVIDGQ